MAKQDKADKSGDKPVRDSRGRFLPGNNANPHGRPPAEFSITELMRAKVAERPAVIMRLLDLCESPDENVALKALIAVANRIDGMPRQQVDVNDPNRDRFAGMMQGVAAAIAKAAPADDVPAT